MLEEVLTELNNWFVVDGGIHEGEFTIEGGGLTLPFLQTGQYFRICGSVFNDGLHKYPAIDLVDETFTGTVWAMAVPAAVVRLSDDIAEWQSNYGQKAASPFSSEDYFGKYSYTKTTENPATWQKQFKARLNAYRKIGGGYEFTG